LNQTFKNKNYIFFFIPFILGFFTSFSFSPYNLIFINFLTFPAFLYLLNVGKKFKLNNKYFFLIGWLFGFGYFLSGLYWISISLTHEEIFRYLIPFAVILVPAFLAIFYGICTLILKKFVSKKISFILFFSLVFSILEFIRGSILGGFPWNLIAYSWSWSLEIIQVISIIGTYSLNLISITIFSLPFILFVKTKYNKKYWFFSFLLILFAINYLYGFKVLLQSKQKNINKHDFVIKIISPNIDLKEFLKNENNDIIIKKLIELSNPKADQKTIFIWPEGMFASIYLSEIKKYHKIFSKAFSNLHLIIFGINNLKYQNNIESIYNSLAVVDNNLNLLSSYNKNKLVPFGEFLPMEKYLQKIGLKKITYGYKSFSRGEQRNVINIKNKYYDFKLLPLICYEIIYSGKINIKKQNVDLIVNISEDGWFGNSIGPHQHFNKAIYRAIEEGNYIARSANNGISAFIDPNGRILHKIKFNDVNTIVASLPKYKSKTIFSKYGNKVFTIIIILYILLIFYFKKVEKNE
jgi:apolipoprotein N-acyltransferase